MSDTDYQEHYSLHDVFGRQLTVFTSHTGRPRIGIESGDTMSSARTSIEIPTDPAEIIDLVSAILVVTKAPFVITDEDG